MRFPSQASPGLHRWLLLLNSVIVLTSFCPLATAGEDTRNRNSVFPEPLTDSDFRALRENSPFIRTVRLTDSLILTGIAHLGEEPVVALLDAEDGSSITISEEPNARGWRLVELLKPEDVELAMVRMAFPTGEVIRIRHDKDRIKTTNQRLGYLRKAQAQRAAAMQRMQQNGGGGSSHGLPRERVALLQKIDASELPKGYNPGAGGSQEAAHRLHQSYVDRRLSGMSDRQKGRMSHLWNQKQAADPMMKNRGAAFVRIMEHVAENEPR